MKSVIRVLLVDDEAPARNRMRFLLEELDEGFKVAGEAANGTEAIKKVRETDPDLLLLDIQMPVLDGFDVVELLGESCPPVIFVTAYDEYAIRAFEIHAVDYLMKPVRMRRLKKALDRLDDRQYRLNQLTSIHQLIRNLEVQHRSRLQKLPVIHKNQVLLLDLDEIDYIEADGKLTRVYTDNKKYRVDFTLNELEQRLSHFPFLRIHRSHIVNLDRVQKLETWFKDRYRLELYNGTELDVARRRVAGLKEKLGMK